MNYNDFKTYFADAEVTEDKVIIKDRLHDTIEFLATKMPFDMLKEITAVDSGNGETEIIYHMYSDDGNEDLFVSTTVREEAETITDIFKSAIADENEIYDLFGIKFNGNENLKRIYMPEDWEGFPLRKDYVETDERLAWNNDSHNV